MNNKITIVTAFFPIKREEWKGFERSNNKYIEYFKFWGRIKNDMIIYTTPLFSSEIKKIREEFGCKNTKVVEIEDVTSIDRELYSSIKKVSKNEKSVDFRINPEFPESWNAEYNYTVCLKPWFVQDAIKKNKIRNHVAWIDFGFNHGGEVYTNEKDFAFEWKYHFDDKINIFLKHELDEKPIFEICRKMDTYIQGSMIVAPEFYWEKLWIEFRNAMISLNDVGLMDDDQTIMLMVYRKNKNDFSTHYLEKWHTQFVYFSEKKFAVNTNNQFQLRGLKNIKNKIRYMISVFKYQKKWRKKMIKEEVKG